MNNDEFTYIVTQIVLVVISMFIGIVIGIHSSNLSALGEGFMEYDKITGELEWKNINTECLEGEK